MGGRGAIAFTMLMALAGCGGGGHLSPLAAAPAGPYRVASGDELRVSVFGLDALANTYKVSEAGTISVPLINSVVVAGKTTSEVEGAIADLLRRRDVSPQAVVTVQVDKYRPFYVLGEVQKPGEYPYSPGMTMLKAVSLAGGYTFRADKKRLVVTRGGTSNGLATQMTAVQPGDTILIPEAWF